MARPIGGGHDRRGTHAPQSAAERAAAEVFVYLMRQQRVRHFDLVLWYSTRSITHHALSGPNHEVIHRYELAPPFWPLTMRRTRGELVGYGVNRDAVCIAYANYRHPTSDHVDGDTVERVDFAPGCRELIGRASRANPVFVCERLASRRATEILKDYLIDAVISLTAGRGALIVNTHDSP